MPQPGTDTLATYVPPRLLTNADLEKLVDTTDDWILQRTGIRERHIVEVQIRMALGEELQDTGELGHMCAGQDRKPDRVRVFLQRIEQQNVNIIK